MAWELIRRDDTFESKNQPYITIGPDRISFNALFTRIAELQRFKTVRIYADRETLRLGFEFLLEEEKDSLVIIKSRGYFSCSARGNIKKHPWVSSVAMLARKDRKFSPTKEGKLWVIQLCPSFENRRARESADIPSEARGIYRYLRANKEIVYIGRGAIRNRLNDPDRQEWDFDIVEYSVIEDPDQQVKWEDYWIERFKEENEGNRPFYNKISGSTPKVRGDD
jgi:hypothetical protein